MKTYWQCVRQSWDMGVLHIRATWRWHRIWSELKSSLKELGVAICDVLDVLSIVGLKLISWVLPIYGGYKIYRRQKK